MLFILESKKSDIDNILKEKLRLCCIIFDFNNSDRIEERERKEKTLLEIIEFIRFISIVIPDYIYEEIFHMAGCNVFRTLAPFHPNVTLGIEYEEDYQFEESWPHLQVNIKTVIETMDLKEANMLNNRKLFYSLIFKF